MPSMTDDPVMVRVAGPLNVQLQVAIVRLADWPLATVFGLIRAVKPSGSPWIFKVIRLLKLSLPVADIT